MTTTRVTCQWRPLGGLVQLRDPFLARSQRRGHQLLHVLEPLATGLDTLLVLLLPRGGGGLCFSCLCSVQIQALGRCLALFLFCWFFLFFRLFCCFINSFLVFAFFVCFLVPSLCFGFFRFLRAPASCAFQRDWRLLQVKEGSKHQRSDREGRNHQPTSSSSECFRFVLRLVVWQPQAQVYASCERTATSIPYRFFTVSILREKSQVLDGFLFELVIMYTSNLR